MYLASNPRKGNLNQIRNLNHAYPCNILIGNRAKLVKICKSRLLTCHQDIFFKEFFSYSNKRGSTLLHLHNFLHPRISVEKLHHLHFYQPILTLVYLGSNKFTANSKSSNNFGWIRKNTALQQESLVREEKPERNVSQQIYAAYAMTEWN